MNSKRIGIDARLYFQTGVGTYVRNLIRFLPKFTPGNIEFYLYVLPQDIPRITITYPRMKIRPVAASWHSLSEQTTFYDILMKDRLDLMHFTYFSYPVRYKRPFIATIHDLTPLLFKTGRASTMNPLFYELKYRVFRYILKKQIERAVAIITPTNTIKQQIAQIYGVRCGEKTTSIYEGVDYELLEAEQKPSIQLPKNIPHDYLLYVGNFYPHKNVERLILAYRFIKPTGKPALVLVGPDNFFAKKLRNFIQKSNIDSIYFLHDTSREELVALYKKARALVNPSLSEGFGLPLIEATYFHCPVIASDIPVFKELLGAKYSSFDPTDVSDISSKLEKKKEKC